MGEPRGDGSEVLVVGAGPTGLVMASQLARHGVPVRIMDKNPAPSSVSKAIAVQARTLEVFEDMGIVQGADAIDDVDRADKHQQDCCEHRTSSTSHLLLLSDRAASPAIRCVAGWAAF